MLASPLDAGGIVRVYELSTNTFAVYNPEGTTATIFKPDRGLDYFRDQPGSLIDIKKHKFKNNNG